MYSDIHKLKCKIVSEVKRRKFKRSNVETIVLYTCGYIFPRNSTKMGWISMITTLLFILVLMKGEAKIPNTQNNACPIFHFSSDFTLDFECFNVYAYNSRRTQNILNAFEFISVGNWSSLPSGALIDKAMEEQITKLYIMNSVYDPFFRFLFWLRNVETAIQNIKDNSSNPCQHFNSTAFNFWLKAVGYKGLLLLQEDGAFLEIANLQTFLHDLPFSVYLSMEDNFNVPSRDTDGILSHEVEGILGILIDYGYIEQRRVIGETLSNIAPLVSDALTKLTYMVSSYDFTVRFFYLSQKLHICRRTRSLSQNDIQNELKPLKDALNIITNEIRDLAVIICDIIARNDRQHHSGTTEETKQDSTTGFSVERPNPTTEGYSGQEGTGAEPAVDSTRVTSTIAGEPGPKATAAPTAREYRASYEISQEPPFVIGEVAHKFETKIFIVASEGSTFAGARQDNVIINVINKKSFRDEATITMTVDSVTSENIVVRVTTDASASWNFTIAIKGQPVLNSESTDPLQVNVTVKHSAPTCLYHRFTDSGNAIGFKFNVTVNVTRSEGSCADFFEDISSLGNGAMCGMKTPKLLLVTIGEGANLIVPDDQLVFKENVIKPARQMFYQSFDIRQYSIDPPRNQPRPSFTFLGPRRINRCGTYQLTAEQITGHGGRPVTYQWRGLPTLGPNGQNEEHESPELLIYGTDLTPGIFNVSLTITNFLQKSQTETHTIAVLDEITPVLEIKPLNFIPNRVRVSFRVQLEAVVTFSFGDGCHSYENKPAYEWSSLDVVIPSDPKNDRVLVLPPNTLPADETILISVTVMFPGNIYLNEMIQLVTVSSPLVAKITGANTMTLGPNEFVSLDGSKSHDPNDKNSNPLNFQWACVNTLSLKPCDDELGSSLTSSVLLVETSLFTAETYTIYLTVSNGATNASAFVTLIIRRDDVPVINITTLNEKTYYRDDEGIFIQANVKSSSEYINITWREESDRLNPDLWEHGSLTRKQDEHITHVIIPSNQTTPGFQYTLEVIATDQNDRIGFAKFNIGIYRPITNCEVTATPYREMNEITITATGCVADPDLVPLLYQPIFALPLQKGYKKIVLDGTSTDSSQTVIASPINYHQDRVLVGFRICDASFTCFDELVVTAYETAPKLSESEQENFINNSINKELEKGNIATAFRNAINIANLQKKTTLKTRRKRRDTAFSFTLEGDFDSVLLVVNGQNVPVNENDEPTLFERLARKQAAIFYSAGPIDVNEGALMSDLSPQMLISMFTEDEIDGVFNTMSRILDKATEEGSSYNKDTIERLLTTLKMGEDNLKFTTKENKERQNTARRLRQTALKQAGQDLNINEHVTFNLYGPKMFVAYSFPKDGENVTDSIVPSVSVKLGRNLTDRFGYDWCRDGASGACSGIKTMVIETNSMDKNIKTCSGTFRVSLLNPITNEEQQIQDPINITMATKELREGETCVCKYWNEETSRLESEGVTSEITDDGRLLCKSSHLAVYVGVYSTNGNARQDVKLGRNNPAILLGIVFGIIFVAILMAAVTIKVLKGNQRNKVTPVTKNPEDESIEGVEKMEDGK